MGGLIIQTVEDIKVFFQLLKDNYNIDFHPDYNFENYINIENDEAVFTIDEAKYFKMLMERSFKICEKEGIEIYSIGQETLFV